PLTGSAAQTERVIAVARATGTPLWEAFAFPFHDQMARLRGILADGTIGDLREIQSDFHFLMGDPDTNVRMFSDLEGGAEHEGAWARAEFAPGGVDRATWGCLDFPGGRHLYLSCGFGRADDTFTRLLGAGGQIHVTNPFHPRALDTFVVCQDGRAPVTHRGIGPYRQSFTPLIRHIQAVVGDGEAPRLLAADTALGSARALHDLAQAAKAP